MNLDIEVWLATALLHRANPARTDFTLPEIRSKVIELNPRRASQKGLNTYLSSHCVASKKRQDRSIGPRILTDAGSARRRLYRAGDPYHESRAGGKVRPDPEDIPAQFRGLVDWYERVYSARPMASPAQRDRMEALREVVGTITKGDLELMKRAIEQACEQVDEEHW
jgi:hypothetical protein